MAVHVKSSWTELVDAKILLNRAIDVNRKFYQQGILLSRCSSTLDVVSKTAHDAAFAHTYLQQ